MMTTFITKLRKLVAEDELSVVFEQLQLLLKHSPYLNEILQQSGRFAAITKKINAGIAGREEGTVTMNRIRQSTIELIAEIEKRGLQSEDLNKEITAAVATISVSNSSGVLINSPISTQGDVYVGTTIDKNEHKTEFVKSIFERFDGLVGLGKLFASISFIFSGLMILFLRRDIIYRGLEVGDVPIKALFPPIFVVILGMLILFYKKK